MSADIRPFPISPSSHPPRLRRPSRRKRDLSPAVSAAVGNLRRLEREAPITFGAVCRLIARQLVDDGADDGA